MDDLHVGIYTFNVGGIEAPKPNEEDFFEQILESNGSPDIIVVSLQVCTM